MQTVCASLILLKCIIHQNKEYDRLFSSSEGYFISGLTCAGIQGATGLKFWAIILSFDRKIRHLVRPASPQDTSDQTLLSEQKTLVVCRHVHLAKKTFEKNTKNK